MKKTILVSLAAFVLILSGCTPTAPTGRQNAKYLGTDGKNYFYAGASQYIKIPDLEARRNDFGRIVNSFKLPKQ